MVQRIPARTGMDRHPVREAGLWRDLVCHRVPQVLAGRTEEGVVLLTKRELSQLYYLNKEIAEEKRKLAELEAAAEGGATKITGMPHVGGASNQVERYALEIAELKDIIDTKIRLAWHELNRLNRYITGVEVPRIRQILTLRHVNGLTWRQVARDLDGRVDTEESVKKAYYRFLKRAQSCPECPEQGE